MVEMNNADETLTCSPAVGDSNLLMKHHSRSQHTAKMFNHSEPANVNSTRKIVRRPPRRKLHPNCKQPSQPKTQHARLDFVNNSAESMDHSGLDKYLQVNGSSKHFCDSVHGTVLPLTCLLSRKHSQPSLVQYNCDMCDFKTARLGNIVTHNKLLHTPVKSSILSSLPAEAQNCDVFSTSASHQTKKSEMRLSAETDADELPDIVTSESKPFLSEGDLVWFKAYRYPYWPAVVKNVYAVKNKLKKVTVLFLEIGPQRKPYTVSGANIMRKISRFGNEHENHDQHIKEFCRSAYGEIAKEILEQIDEYFLLKQQQKVSCSALKYFNLLSQEHDKEMENELNKSQTEEVSVDNLQNNNTLAILDGEVVDPWLKSCLKKRYERCQQLLDYCRTPDIKDYMKKILSGEIYSVRHQLYNKPSLEPEEKCLLRNISFGPIEDEEQQNQLVHILKAQYKSVSSLQSYQSMKYFTDVVFPEVIIHAIQATFRKSRHEAEQLYNEGFVLSRRENKEREMQLKETLTRVESQTGKHQLGKIRCRLHLKL